MIALGQGGQALDVDAEETPEGIGLGLAEFRELGGDVADRAMPLAQLDTDIGVVAHRPGTRRETLRAEGLDEGVGAGQGVIPGRLDQTGDPVLQCSDPLVGEGTHGLLAPGAVQEAHRLGGEFVVVGHEMIVTRLVDDPLTRRAAATSLAGVRRPTRHGALLGELVEVPAYAGGSQAEMTGERRGRDRPALADHRQDPVPGPRIAVRVVNVRRPRRPH